jgi:LPXTG-motif cell wall-anchored protein
MNFCALLVRVSPLASVSWFGWNNYTKKMNWNEFISMSADRLKNASSVNPNWIWALFGVIVLIVIITILIGRKKKKNVQQERKEMSKMQSDNDRTWL